MPVLPVTGPLPAHLATSPPVAPAPRPVLPIPEPQIEREEEDDGAEPTEEEAMAGSADEDAPETERRRQRRGQAEGLQVRYKAFALDYDEVVDAVELCDSDELTRLRQHLDQQLAHLQGIIGRLANRLQRRLMAKQSRSWEFDLEEGLLDAGRLARVIVNPMHPLSYKQEHETEFRDTIVRNNVSGGDNNGDFVVNGDDTTVRNEFVGLLGVAFYLPASVKVSP